MTKTLLLVTACGLLTWSGDARAQSNAPSPPQTLASQYVNTDTGIALDEAITRALAQEPSRDPWRVLVQEPSPVP